MGGISGQVFLGLEDLRSRILRNWLFAPVRVVGGCKHRDDPRALLLS